MDLSSWFRRTLLRNTEKTKSPDPPKQALHQNEPEDELLGVTEQLIDHVKSFTLETFKNFPLPGMSYPSHHLMPYLFVFGHTQKPKNIALCVG